MFPSKLSEFSEDSTFVETFKACLLNHGVENRAKDLFFVSYEQINSVGVMCKGVKIKVLSSVSVLQGEGSADICQLIPATKILYSTVQCQDIQMIALMSQMSITKIVTGG